MLVIIMPPQTGDFPLVGSTFSPTVSPDRVYQSPCRTSQPTAARSATSDNTARQTATPGADRSGQNWRPVSRGRFCGIALLRPVGDLLAITLGLVKYFAIRILCSSVVEGQGSGNQQVGPLAAPYGAGAASGDALGIPTAHHSTGNRKAWIVIERRHDRIAGLEIDRVNGPLSDVAGRRRPTQIVELCVQIVQVASQAHQHVQVACLKL